MSFLTTLTREKSTSQISVEVVEHMKYSEYKNLGYKIKEKLMEDVNGIISFIVFDNDDSLTIDIENDGFVCRYLLACVSVKMDMGRTVEDFVEDIKAYYDNQIHNKYFKSIYKKRREAEAKNELTI